MNERRRQILRDSWSLLRLFVVGVAWGAPLIPIVFANTNPGVAAHPQLAGWLEPLLPAAFLLVPLAAVAGVVLIARLSPHSPRLTTASGLSFAVLAGLPLILGALGSALDPLLVLLPLPEDGPDDTGFMVFTAILLVPAAIALLEIALALLLGLLVTLRTLWCWRRWLAPLWLALWLFMSASVWFGSQQTPEGGNDFGGGLLAVLLIIGLLCTSLATTIVVAGVRGRRRHAPDVRRSEA